jgi:hypothetical protein
VLLIVKRRRDGPQRQPIDVSNTDPLAAHTGGSGERAALPARQPEKQYPPDFGDYFGNPLPCVPHR